jgi:hypothetical protein
VTEKNSVLERMKNKLIEVRHKGVTVKIFTSHTGKYTYYQVPDYSSGKRKLWSFSNVDEAKSKALEIAGPPASGETDLIPLSAIKSQIQLAVELVGESCIVPACQIYREAAKLIDPEEILQAVRYWKERRPDKPFSPKMVKDATADYLARQGRLSPRRKRTLKSYFASLESSFGERLMHELTTVEIKDWMASKPWGEATFNSMLCAFKMLYRDALARNWVPEGCDPMAAIKRFRLKPRHIEILEPSEVRTLFAKVSEDLIPFLAIWFFGGHRKDEVARLHWTQVRNALKTGKLELTGDQALKNGARSASILPTLRAWLEWYLQRNPDASGLVLPVKYSGGRKLDNVQRTIKRQTKVRWVPNAGRHSYISYRCKIADSVTTVADEVGNSPAQIERHYRKKGILKESAEEYFAIMPPTESNVIPMPTESKQANKLAATA